MLALDHSNININTKPANPFVRRNGPSFSLKGKPFKFVGINYYPLVFGTSKANVQKVFDDAKAKGITVMRTWCYDPPGFFRTLSFVLGSNLISNNSFETNTTGYVLDADYSRSNDTAQDGTWSIKQVSAYNTFGFFSYLASGLSTNTDYVWTIQYKLTNTPGSSNQLPPRQIVGTARGASDIADGGLLSNATSFTQRQVHFNTGSHTSVYLAIENFGGQNTAYYDNFNLSLKGAATLTYNEPTLANLDMVLDEARKRDIKLILSLADGNENGYNTKGVYVQWANTIYGAGLANAFPWLDFYSNVHCKSLYKDFVNTLTQRINTINGLQYKDDPSIFSWELGNELRANSFGTGDNSIFSSILALVSMPGGWADEMSTYIKSKDPNHLVSYGDMGHTWQYSQDGSGNGDHVSNGTYYGVDYDYLTRLPNIDYLDFHLYPDQSDNVHLLYFGQRFGYVSGISGDGLRAQLKDYVNVGHANNKPVICGEVGFISGTTGDNTYYPLYNRYQAFLNIFKDFFDIPGGDGVIPWHAVPAATSGSYDIALEATGGEAVTDNTDDTNIVNLISKYNTAYLHGVISAQKVTGIIKTNGDIVLKDLNNADPTIAVQLADTWTGTVVFERTIDGFNWVSCNLTNSAGSVVSTTTANDIFTGSIVGMSNFRVRATASMTGQLCAVIQSSS